MFLRAIVSHFVQTTARQKLQEALVEGVGQASGARSEGKPFEPCNILFVFAMNIESGGSVDLLQDSEYAKLPSFAAHVGQWGKHKVAVIDGGVGAQKASLATENAIKILRPNWVVSAGFAGGLNDALHKGQILMADKLADEKGNELDVGFAISPEVAANTKGLHVGRLLTVNRLISEVEEKKQLGETHNALACDMETFAVAKVCAAMKVRLLSVRVISDSVHDQLPPEIEKLMQQQSLASQIGAAAGAIFNRPSSVKDMWKLREDALKASDRLARFLAGIADQLPVDTRPPEVDPEAAESDTSES